MSAGVDFGAAMMTTRPENERVILLDSCDSKCTFMTEDDGGVLRIYEGEPPDDWPRDLLPDRLGDHG